MPEVADEPARMRARQLRVGQVARRVVDLRLCRGRIAGEHPHIGDGIALARRARWRRPHAQSKSSHSAATKASLSRFREPFGRPGPPLDPVRKRPVSSRSVIRSPSLGSSGTGRRPPCSRPSSRAWRGRRCSDVALRSAPCVIGRGGEAAPAGVAGDQVRVEPGGLAARLDASRAKWSGRRPRAESARGRSRGTAGRSSMPGRREPSARRRRAPSACRRERTVACPCRPGPSSSAAA